MGDYELYHAATRKHKYIKKIGNRYFYTQQEIQAYLEGKKQSVSDMDVDLIKKHPGLQNNKGNPTIGIELKSDKRRKFDKNAGSYLIDKNGRPYTEEYYNKKKGIYVKDKKITAYSTKGGSTNTHTLDLNKPKDVGFEKTKWIDGSGDKQVNVYKLNLGSKDGVVNSVGVAAGNKTVSAFNSTNKATAKNAKKYGDEYVTKRRGRLSSEYDSEFGSYHTLDLAGKKEYKKRAKETAKHKKEYGDTYIDVREERKKKVNKAKKSAKKHVKKSLKSMKKQSARGKKALAKFYKNNINPGVTVTYDEAVIK